MSAIPSEPGKHRGYSGYEGGNAMKNTDRCTKVVVNIAGEGIFVKEACTSKAKHDALKKILRYRKPANDALAEY